MADILEEYPWDCGEKDCAQQWHKTTIWVDPEMSSGYSIDTFSDGDHDELEAADIPRSEEVEERWDTYARYVAKTGEDPLQTFYCKVATEYTRPVVWQLRFRYSILGLSLVGFRRSARGPYQHPREIPQHLREYFWLEESPSGASVLTTAADSAPDGSPVADRVDYFRQLIEEDENCRLQHSPPYAAQIVVRLEETTQRSSTAIRRDLKRAAQLELR